ncbi:MAG: outer membrane protein assembly factor [Gemmatimonadota bacterium]|nr:outer membrane protein assembly factor [Gemmatimonadota bacterium]
MDTTLFVRARTACGLATVLVLGAISTAAAQNPTRIPGSDSVVVIPGEIYRAEQFHRALLGDNYREEWTTPIKVPVLNLRTFHGGLTPGKTGGGAQTISLRFDAADGSKWVFRSVKKRFSVLPEQYKGTIIWYIARDEGSASHPLGAIAADPLQAAIGVLHPHPAVAVMPDDPLLGEHREQFAGMLGELEERPDVSKNGPAFAGASKIVGSDTLLDRINTDPETRVDARTLLTALELDLLIGDNDRHPDQWKWARFGGHQAAWEPIAVDRDHAFVSYEGLVMKIARFAVPTLVIFKNTYPDPSALFANANEFDRRMLGTLDGSVWDSIAVSLQQRITDQVIDNAVATLPPEYANGSRKLATKLKTRRNGLREAADLYYRELWKVADIHGTDADDQATVVRAGNGIVDVTLHSGNSPPYFVRRFNAAETHEIRIYLHGGNDRATVEGNVGQSIPVKIIGGNGDNQFVDLSTVGGRRNPTRFYDVGIVNSVVYARDTVDEKFNIDDAFNHYFNRRPWQRAYGKLIPPQKDRGASIKPVAGIHSQRGLGIYPVIGLARTVYGFRKVPYSTMTEADVGYSFSSRRLRVRGNFDKRFEESDVHIPVAAHMSQFEIVQFHGFGNDVPDLRGTFYDVRQRQWTFNPAIGRSFSPVSDISLGPIVRSTTTDSVANRFIAQQQPYGFTRFGEAGMRLKMHLDSKYAADTIKPRLVLDVAGSGYPGMWDVAKPYESLDGWAAAFFTLPMPKKPVLAFRAGGKKLWGNFPYFDAAFLGGSETFRTEERQRYAGDAAVYGTTELRVPIAKFPFILPLDVGALGFVDAGRVYLKGASPGGWHTAAGAGFWVGYLNPGTNVNVLFTNNRAHRVNTSIGFAF